jgi:type I restriction enzyme M protein
MCSHLPFGAEWKTEQKIVTNEHEQRGFAGGSGPGLPQVSDA